MDFVDLHFHLLPGVDDGPADLSASLELARGALAEGAGTVVATPHVREDLGLTDAVEIDLRVRELRAQLADARIPLEIRCGGELGYDMVFRLSQRQLDLLAQGPPGGRWVLVETPFEGIGEDFHAARRSCGRGGSACWSRIRSGARTPRSTRRRPAARAASRLAGPGERALADRRSRQRRAQGRLGAPRGRAGLVAVVASDAHGPRRPPAMRFAHRALVAGGVAPATAAAITSSEPRSPLARGMRRGNAVAA